MLTFLFWNIRRRPLQGLIAEIVEAYDVDILLLAECDIDGLTMTNELYINTRERFWRIRSPSERIATYTKFSPRWVRRILDEDGLSIRHMSHPIHGQLLVVSAHLRSRLHRTIDELNFSTPKLRSHIEEAEELVGHRRTVVVGDLNLNPFDSGVVGSEGFHGVMDRQTAGRNSRRVEGHTRRFFYNPMWSRLGGESVGPAGTYYYNSASPVNHFWHTFDQVLIRPELLPNFRDEDLIVLTEINSHSFLTANGLPNARVASDHLPLLFKLHFSSDEVLE